MVQDKVNSHASQMKLMDLLMEQAEEGTLHNFLEFVSDLRGEQEEEGKSRKRKERKRWYSYGATVRSRFRRQLDVATLLWGSSLVAMFDRANEGGKHMTIHLSHGRKPPRGDIPRAVSNLLRQSGLKARIRYHTSNSTVLYVSF
ncbi:hypothetical protein ACFLZO_01000 [Patescibacteria group bacterium]